MSEHNKEHNIIEPTSSHTDNEQAESEQTEQVESSEHAERTEHTDIVMPSDTEQQGQYDQQTNTQQGQYYQQPNMQQGQYYQQPHAQQGQQYYQQPNVQQGQQYYQQPNMQQGQYYQQPNAQQGQQFYQQPNGQQFNQQAYYQQHAYGQPMHTYERVTTNNKSILSIIFGIASLFLPFIGLILAIVTLFIAPKAMSEIKNSPVKQDGRGLAITGLVTSIICVAFYAFYIFIVLLVFILDSSY